MSAAGAPPRSNRRVSFLFRRSEAAGHCAGVNALALSPDDRHLWTGSRDSIIACWDAAEEPQPALAHEHVGHIDWVNDLALVGDVLVSCSSDKTLRVWQPDSPEPALGCLRGHSDYVTCLAASAAGGMLASGGLRGEVLLWDLTGLRAVMSGAVAGQGYGASAAEVPADSVYALSMNTAGSLLAAGSTQGAVSVADARSGQSVMQLQGHTDNVRALQLDPDGRLLASGGADHTLRLWDLGQQRCVQTLAAHTDSVWALAAGPGFATLYSGGRDGCIYRTRLATRVSELVACEERPVTRLALGSDDRHLWAATASPSVHKWRFEAGEAPAVGGGGAPATPRSPLGGGAPLAPLMGSCFVASPSPAARARLAFDVHGSRPSAQQQRPVAATPGLPPIQNAAVLTDRRHVLTQDSEGSVLCWDLTAGRVVRDFGRADLKEAEAALFQPSHSVSAWCAAEVKLGSLGGTMEPPQCFGAEIYAQDLGDEEAPVDLKVNFGEQMLLALFAGWAQRRRGPQQAPGQQVADGGAREGNGSGAAQGAAEGAAAGGGDAAMPDADGQPQGAGDAAAPPSRFDFTSALPPVVLVSGGGSGGGGAVPWRCAIDAFSGEEDVPQWVADCVLHGRYPASRDLKMAFQLLPLPGSPLPSLLQSKLTAPRVLRVNKVADYVRRKVEEAGVALREEPLFWDAAKAERWHAEQAGGGGAAAGDGIGAGPGGAAPGVHPLHPLPPGAAAPGARGGGGAVLITCGGHTVPWDFSLAAVRQWIWRRSDDLVLHYSVRDHGTPLRLPAIRPPS